MVNDIPLWFLYCVQWYCHDECRNYVEFLFFPVAMTKESKTNEDETVHGLFPSGEKKICNTEDELDDL